MNENLKNWELKIADKAIPVLNSTIAKLHTLCKNEKSEIHKLVDVIEEDPALCVQVLRLSNQQTRGSLRTDITSINQALMIIGTEKINSLPSNLPSIEKNLSPESRNQLLITYSRAYHAATQAVTWAKIRKDMTPDEVYVASMLYFLGEIIVAIYAPKKLKNIYKMRREKHIATEEAEYIVLGFTIDELTLLLAKKWDLPELLQDAIISENTQQPRSYGVKLAVQLIRHAEFNWYDDKTIQIERDTAEWLNIDFNSLVSDIHQLAASIARHSSQYGIRPLAYHLPITKIITEEIINNTEQLASICLMPNINILQETLITLTKNSSSIKNINNVMSLVLKGMHDGIGLNRVIFLLLNNEKDKLKLCSAAGTDNDLEFNSVSVKLNKKNLFGILLEKQQAIWLNEKNFKKTWPLVPPEIKKISKSKTFFAMSVHVREKPIGLFYADRHNDACELDIKSYNHFKTLCTETATFMTKFSK
jgi:HD-like signal output (HDOD) protein